MPLVASPRHSKRDLQLWEYYQRLDELHVSRFNEDKADKALDAIAEFSIKQPCYAGVSWGKDSTVLAHLLARLYKETGIAIPLVWVRVEPISNPDCPLVRDLFLQRYPGYPYEEVEIWCSRDDRGWHASGTLEKGFRAAVKKYGRGHVSGVRAAESGIRKMRGRRFGTTSGNSCAPMIWWSGDDVFAYLRKYDLPVHPAYACSMDGLFERERIRVTSLAGERGKEHGRYEWESRYYGNELRLIEEAIAIE